MVSFDRQQNCNKFHFQFWFNKEKQYTAFSNYCATSCYVLYVTDLHQRWSKQCLLA